MNLIRVIVICFAFLASGTILAQKTSQFLNKIPLDEAKKALENPDYSDYLTAVYTILTSEMEDSEKHKAVLKFLEDEDKLKKLSNQKIGNSTMSAGIMDVLRFAIQNLEEPSKLILSLYDNELYNPKNPYPAGYYHGCLVISVKELENPSPKLVDKIITGIKTVDDLSLNKMTVVAKNADDKTLKRLLDLSRKNPNPLKPQHYFPRAMRSARHRPLVIEYFVTSYFEYNNPRSLWEMIVNDEVGMIKFSSYQNVKPEDAQKVLEQIDRIYNKRTELRNLTKVEDRPTERELKRFKEIHDLLERKAYNHKPGKP